MHFASTTCKESRRGCALRYVTYSYSEGLYESGGANQVELMSFLLLTQFPLIPPLQVVVQHREPWQNVGTVLDSKGNLMSYCAEVQKMLGIQYKAPPMPVDLTLASGTELSAKSPDTFESPQVNADDIGQSDSRQNQAEVFSSMARNRHHIVV